MKAAIDFLGLGGYRLLAGDLAELVDRRVENLGILRGLAHTHVDHDLVQVRNRHGILELKFLHQRRRDFALEPALEPRRFLGAVMRLGGLRLLLLLFALFVSFLFCHLLPLELSFQLLRS